MKCPLCSKGKVIELPNLYKCGSCGKLAIFKEINGKLISSEIVEELLEKGRTGLMSGFIGRTSGKEYSAILVLKDGKAVMEFPPKNNKTLVKNKPKIISVRLESGTSGSVYLTIDGEPLKKNADIVYGLIPSRIAECLGCITAAKLIQHHLPDASEYTLEISFNNADSCRYILKESAPRKPEERAVIKYLWDTLNGFANWRAAYEKKKRFKLEGSPQVGAFPKGIFPWLKPEITQVEDGVVLKLPESPDVLAQFTASLRNYEPRSNTEFLIPSKSEAVLKAWLANVR